MGQTIQDRERELAELEATVDPLTELEARRQALREQLAAEQARERRAELLRELVEIAKAAAALEARKASATAKASKAVEAFVRDTLAAVDEQAAHRTRFLDVAGEEVSDLVAELEQAGVDLSGIRGHWVGTRSSAIDREQETSGSPHAEALSLALTVAFHERAQAAESAARAERAERAEQRERNRVRTAQEPRSEVPEGGGMGGAG